MEQSYTPDAFEALDPDKLQVVITILKDAEVSHFRCGELEIYFAEEAEDDEGITPVGFVPMEQRLGVQAEKQAESPYDRAFRGRLPVFPRQPKDK